MRATAMGDVLKVITYVIASFLLAALLTPPLFEWGNGFAQVALAKETGGGVAWLATKAERAEFDTYFKRALFIAGNFLQPELLIHRFLSLLLVGIILGFARYRTASLWLSIGLHAGWVFSLKLFGHLTERRSDFPVEFHLLIGKRMTEGLIPIGMLAFTGAALAAYLKLRCPREAADE